MCGLDSVELDTRDQQLKLERHHGIQFALCPVGHLERIIRSVKESFDERYPATDLKTLAKLIENSYNHQHKKAVGTPVLKEICPNHLRLGRLNTRVLDGHMKREEHLKVVRETYDAWLNIWKYSYVPHLLYPRSTQVAPV